ncbi:MAG: TatD family hydrolase, partial [Burkholderiales bacterium]|nr:TatD family hydrolase [Burkholderiales bacterium]
MWIDSHCHLDAAEYDGASNVIADEARAADVNWILVPAVARANFKAVAELAAEISGCVYALGIHPLYVPQADEEDLSVLRDAVAQALNDKKFIAIGEIGLDFFVPSLCEPAMRTKQEYFYSEQLK